MLLIIGWAGAEYGVDACEFLPAAVQGFCVQEKLTGCLAALPAKAEQKEWLLSFLSSVRRVSSIHTGVLVRSSVVSTADLVACDAAKLDQVVIIQDTAEPGAAIDSVCAYQQEYPDSSMSIRVWFDEAVGDGYQAQVCAWKYGAMVDSVELSPFALQGSATNGDGGATDKQSLSCEWLESAITITPSGVVVSCPAHLPKNGHAEAASSTAEVLARHDACRDNAGSNPVCRSCHRLARFAGANEIVSPIEGRPGIRQFAAAPQYEDFVGGDLSSFSLPEQKASVAEFMARIRDLNSEGNS